MTPYRKILEAKELQASLANRLSKEVLDDKYEVSLEVNRLAIDTLYSFKITENSIQRLVCTKKAKDYFLYDNSYQVKLEREEMRKTELFLEEKEFEIIAWLERNLLEKDCD